MAADSLAEDIAADRTDWRSDMWPCCSARGSAGLREGCWPVGGEITWWYREEYWRLHAAKVFAPQDIAGKEATDEELWSRKDVCDLN